MAISAHRTITKAVHRHRHLSKQGLLERAFTFAFRGLVYAQIWEDPAVDMEALAFFQAEDGMRDGRVTGVQTCALPI